MVSDFKSFLFFRYPLVKSQLTMDYFISLINFLVLCRAQLY